MEHRVAAAPAAAVTPLRMNNEMGNFAAVNFEFRDIETNVFFFLLLYSLYIYLGG